MLKRNQAELLAWQSFVFLTNALFSPFPSIQILTSLQISLLPPIWAHLHPPSPIIFSLMPLKARCQVERRPHPAPVLLASLATASMKTSSPSTAQSWLLWWWAWWLISFLRGQLVEKTEMKAALWVKTLAQLGFTPQPQCNLGQSE